MGPTIIGVKILEGARCGMKEIIVRHIQEDIINDADWEPEADKIQEGFQVSFG